MRYAVATVFVLAALLSVTQLSAVQTATVTGKQSVLVTTTDAALLGLEPGTSAANAAGTAYYSPDSTTRTALLLDFRKGYSTTTWGFLRRDPVSPQPNPDKYRYKGLFRVTNRSGEQQCIRVYVSTLYSSAPSDLVGIYIRPAGPPYSDTGTQVAGASGAPIGTPPSSGCHTAVPGEVLEVDFWFEVTTTSALVFSFDVRVEGIRVP